MFIKTICRLIDFSSFSRKPLVTVASTDKNYRVVSLVNGNIWMVTAPSRRRAKLKGRKHFEHAVKVLDVVQ